MIPRGPRLVALAALLGVSMLQAQEATPPDPPLDSSVIFHATGGDWHFGASHGRIRLLVLRDARAQPGLLVIEWIEVQAGTTSVRDTRLVSVITSPWRLQQPHFLAGGRFVSATLKGTDGNGHEADWILTFGGPGIFSISPVRR